MDQLHAKISDIMGMNHLKIACHRSVQELVFKSIT